MEKERKERRRLGIKLGPYQRKTDRPYDKEAAKLCDGDRKTLRRFYAYRNQCARRRKGVGISFNLTLQLFLSITSSVCFYCGQLSPNKNYCGIDRVDSSIGYEPTNCVPCCKICNKMKLNYSQQFFLAHAEKIHKHMEKKTATRQPEQLLLPL